MEVIQGYTNSYGKNFDVPNYHFETYEEWQKFPKTMVAYSREDKLDTFSTDDAGIYIQKFGDGTKAFRTHSEIPAFNYKAFAERYPEQRLVEKLLKEQSKIKLSRFPEGITTIENVVTGQVIPFYDGYIKFRLFAQNAEMIELYQLYLQTIKIFKELEDNGIIYTDIHTANLVVHPETKDIQLIDFDDHRVYFDRYEFGSMIDNLKATLNRLNEINGLKQITNIDKTNSLNEIEEAVQYDAYKRIRIQK